MNIDICGSFPIHLTSMKTKLYYLNENHKPLTVVLR